MKNIRNFLIVSLIVSFTITLSGCGSKKGNEKKVENEKYDYLVLVNKYSKLPDDWEQNVELVTTKNAWDEDIKVEKKAFEQYKKLKEEVDNDLKDLKTTIELDSTYRSVKEQQDLWDEWSKDPEKGIDYVKKYVAVPGYSEHHTGLAIDICIKKDGKLIFDNDEMIAERQIFSKVHAKLSKYGFILRYLEKRDDITGYAYEPWHLRYVGSSEIAKEIMDKDITFEEYLEKENDLVNNKSAAKYHIENILKKEFETQIYKDAIKNVRFNVKKIYTKDDGKDNSTIKSLNLSDKDIAFEVDYQIQPKDEKRVKELTAVDGKYDKELGWISELSRIGILKYNTETKEYKLDSFGTGW